MIVNKCKTTGELEKELEKAVETCRTMASGCEGMDETFWSYVRRGEVYEGILRQIKQGKPMEEIAKYSENRKEHLGKMAEGFAPYGMGGNFFVCATKSEAYKSILDCIKK